MKLHVFPPSPNSKKVMYLNALESLGIPEVLVDLQTGAQLQPAYLALNPNGKAPVLEFGDGSTLWESNAILNRLAGDAKSDLWPATQDRYDILRWQFWEACHWTPACAKYISYHFFDNHSIDMQAAEVDFLKYAKVLDDHLSGRDWLVGAGMTTADIAVAMILAPRDTCHYPLAGLDNIARWMTGIEAQDAWQKANPAG